MIALGFMLAACGGGADQDSPAEAEDRESVVDPMADTTDEAMDKAEAVEDEAMRQKENLDEAVEDAEDPPEEPPAEE